jgi:hypothetical protein
MSNDFIDIDSAHPFLFDAESYCLKCSKRGNWMAVDKIAGFQKRGIAYYEIEHHGETVALPTSEVAFKKKYRIHGPQHISFGFFGENMYGRTFINSNDRLNYIEECNIRAGDAHSLRLKELHQKISNNITDQEIDEAIRLIEPELPLQENEYKELRNKAKFAIEFARCFNAAGI